jgi:threonylcarbamoyladenosine tRNA methylthiotransferase MtaB
MKKRKAYLLCNGCIENGLDTASTEKYLKENGWLITKNHKEADLILFNACQLTQNRTKYSMKIIKKIQEEKKDSAEFIVWGCLPKVEPETLREKYTAPKFDERELSSLQQIVDPDRPIKDIDAHHIVDMHPDCEPFGKNALIRSETSLFTRIIGYPAIKWACFLESRISLYRPNDPSIYYIKVSTGCLGNCAYCSIRFSRGTVKSKSIEQIISEFKEGLEKGYRSFSLVGTDLGAYGRDIGYTLVDLLREMTNEKGDFKIGLRNVNPFWLKKMLPDLIPIIETKRIWYMGIAAESGSNRILKLMKRRYTIEEFKECIRSIRKAYPDIVIRSQLMVGFPTETKQDHADSIRLLKNFTFDYVEVYRYSKRSGTVAANMEGQVPEKISNKRFLSMNTKALLNRTPRKIKRAIQLSKLIQ